MSFQAPDPQRRKATPHRVGRNRACVPATFIQFAHVAWDGHDLVVISQFDVILD
jgi:hypothetical protein